MYHKENHLGRPYFKYTGTQLIEVFNESKDNPAIDSSKYVFEVNVHGLRASFTKIVALPGVAY